MSAHPTEVTYCAFALHRGRYCMRPAGHEATDGRLPRHDGAGWDEWVAQRQAVIAALHADSRNDRNTDLGLTEADDDRAEARFHPEPYSDSDVDYFAGREAR